MGLEQRLNATEEIQKIIEANLPNAKPSDFIRYGTYSGRQIYLHKPTGVRYTANGALAGRRVGPVLVGAALAMFYSGLSLAQIRRKMEQIFDHAPSTGSIYEWVVDYTNLAKDQLKQVKPPRLGDTWVADEMVLKIGGKKYWNWNVMDAKTRYVLAMYLSPTRSTHDARVAFARAAMKAGKAPKRIITDRLRSYIDGIEQVFGGEAAHVQSGGIRAEVNNNLSERLQGTIRARTKVMRSLKRRDTAQHIMDGWLIYYNHFRPHESLKDRTPAEKAGIISPFKNWEDVARLDVRPFSQKRILQQKGLVEKSTPFRSRPALKTRSLRPRRGALA